jgi:broad specificity phosphatase PhoE
VIRVLARHCRTDWSGTRFCGRSDPPLSAEGRTDAAELAGHLAAATGIIIASPLHRARATADAIARSARLRVVDDARLREIDCGEAEGLTFDEIAARWPSLATALLTPGSRIDWPGGERHADFVARVDAFWGACPDDAVVVTHGGVLGHLLGTVLGSWPATLPARPGPGTLVRLEGPPWRYASHWAPGAAE